MKKLLPVLLISVTVTSSFAQQAFYDVTTGNGNGIRFWQQDLYKIHMGTGSEYFYGPVTDYSIKTNMNSGAPGRGWTWGVAGQVPVAAINSIGNMQIAGGFTTGSRVSVNYTYVDNVIDGSNNYTRSNFGSNVNWDYSNKVWQIGAIGNNDFSSIVHPNNDGLAFITAPSGGNVARSLTNSQFMAYERMRINSSGSVGIGTASPRGQFDVAGTGDIYLVNNPIAGTTQTAYLPGHIFFSPYSGTDWTYLQARRYDNSGSTNLRFRTYNASVVTEAMSILSNGNVGIGTTSPDAKLAVSGQVHAQEVKVSITVPGPDYVFNKDYQLTPLEEIENYIDQNKHLPEVPSAKEMEKNGVQLGEMNMILLKKIEELTLYILEQERRAQDQEKRINALESNTKH